MKKRWSILTASAAAVVSVLALSGCSSAEAPYDPDVLTIYSGREEDLIQPLIDKFSNEYRVEVEVRYAGSAELAAQLLEEGGATPADIFISQDAGALGALSKAEMLLELPSWVLEGAKPQYRSANNDWVGLTGRQRVLVYNPELVSELPQSVLDLADPAWAGMVGIAPSNASFQSFVTALRVLEGEQVAADWLAAMKTNAVIYEKNGAILEAVEAGQIATGLINHYYWYALSYEKAPEPMVSQLANFADGDAGNLVNVSGVGILSQNPAALSFLQFLQAGDAQKYFLTETREYAFGWDESKVLPPLEDLPAPEIDLSDLDTLEQTLEMIRAAGLL